MNVLLKPFAWLLLMLHNIFGSYGLALIFFALIVKVILFPFSLKGKKGMIQMNMLSGKMQQIQKKYANDKNKQNEEIQKLYAKEKVNPMSGCLWSFLPLLILIPLYAVIREPFFYLMDLTKEQLPALVSVLNQFTQTAINEGSAYFQLEAAHVLFQNFNAVVADPSISAFAGNLIQIDFNFLGANLAAVPSWKLWDVGFTWNSIALFLIPIISAGTGLFFSRVSMKTNAVNSQAGAAANNPSMKMMMWMTPLMSLWIGFTMPAGLSIYWIANNVLSMVQEFIAGKMLKKDYEAAAAAQAQHELQEKEEEKAKKREIAERKKREAEEAKLNKGKKKTPAEKKGSDASNNEASKVGIRAYARGRAYDPNRYNAEGPTPYHGVDAPVPETSADKELKKESDHLGQVALEVAADDMIVSQLLEEQTAADQDGQTAETANPADPWAQIDQEIQSIQDDPQTKAEE